MSMEAYDDLRTWGLETRAYLLGLLEHDGTTEDTILDRSKCGPSFAYTADEGKGESEVYEWVNRLARHVVALSCLGDLEVSPDFTRICPMVQAEHARVAEHTLSFITRSLRAIGGLAARSKERDLSGAMAISVLEYHEVWQASHGVRDRLAAYIRWVSKTTPMTINLPNALPSMTEVATILLEADGNADDGCGSKEAVGSDRDEADDTMFCLHSMAMENLTAAYRLSADDAPPMDKLADKLYHVLKCETAHRRSHLK